MIHVSKISEIAKMKEVISIKWVSTEGEIISCDKCVITSFFGNGQTFNVKILSSGEFRKVNRYSVIEFNGEEVIL